MIRYLAYYSFGGYKDMLLGSFDECNTTNEADSSEEEFAYYSPFLQPWMNGQLKDADARTISQLEQIKEKKHIEIIGQSCSYNMPAVATKLASQGGYQIVCCALNDGTFSVAVRNIVGKSKDEFGRPIPFMMQFILSDVIQADKLADYFRTNLESIKTRLGNLLDYNPNLNCLQFHLTDANRLVMESITSSKFNASTSTSQPLRLIVVNRSMKLDYAVQQLGFSISEVATAYYEDGFRVPLHTFRTFDNQTSAFQTTSSSTVSEKHNRIFRLLAQLKNIRFTETDKEDINEIIKHITNILHRHKQKN